VEEAAAAAESLQDQARNLAQVVSVFKLDGRQPEAETPIAKLQPVTPMRARIEPIQWQSSPIRLAAGHGAAFKRVANARSGTNEEWQQC